MAGIKLATFIVNEFLSEPKRGIFSLFIITNPSTRKEIKNKKSGKNGLKLAVNHAIGSRVNVYH
jgi:hypothetical protein